MEIPTIMVDVAIMESSLCRNLLRTVWCQELLKLLLLLTVSCSSGAGWSPCCRKSCSSMHRSDYGMSNFIIQSPFNEHECVYVRTRVHKKLKNGKKKHNRKF
jgi:hypothetical protein